MAYMVYKVHGPVWPRHDVVMLTFENKLAPVVSWTKQNHSLSSVVCKWCARDHDSIGSLSLVHQIIYQLQVWRRFRNFTRTRLFSSLEALASLERSSLKSFWGKSPFKIVTKSEDTRQVFSTRSNPLNFKLNCVIFTNNF